MEKTEKIKLPIVGMHCASCAANLTKALNALEGVETAEVNFAAEQATVIFNPKKLGLDEIGRTVAKAGFQVGQFESAAAKEEQKRKAMAVQKTKLNWAIVFTIPLLYLAMAPMLGLPAPLSRPDATCRR